MLIPLHIQFCILFQNFHQSPPPSSPYISKLCLSFTMTFWTASPCRSNIFDAMSRQDGTVPAFNEWTLAPHIPNIHPWPSTAQEMLQSMPRNYDLLHIWCKLVTLGETPDMDRVKPFGRQGPRTRSSQIYWVIHISQVLLWLVTNIPWTSLIYGWVWKWWDPQWIKQSEHHIFPTGSHHFLAKKKLGISIPAMRLAALPRVLSMKSIRSLIALLIEAGMDRKITTCSVGILGYYSSAGWWYTNPSEKYESQLGWLFQIYGQIELMFQTTNQIWDFGVLFYLFRALDFFMIFSMIFPRLNFSPRDDSGIPGDPRCRLFARHGQLSCHNPLPSMLFIVILQVDTNENHIGNPDEYPKIIKTQMLPQSSSNL